MCPLTAGAANPMAKERSLALLDLPMDIQASILAFLPHSDLVHFSRVSQG
jgi:hypothetical protein